MKERYHVKELRSGGYGLYLDTTLLATFYDADVVARVAIILNAAAKLEPYNAATIGKRG